MLVAPAPFTQNDSCTSSSSSVPSFLVCAVAPGDLEDRDADSWTVGSRPQEERYTGGSRVGAFAAAAGRGASAFVEAFRSVVGNHRTTYSTRHSGTY